MPEALYRQVVESAPNAMVMADSAGKIVLVNRQAERLFGYDRAELLGRPVEILLPAALRERHRGYREEYGKRPETRAMGAGRDLRGVRKDGTEIPVEIGLNPIEADGQRYVLAAIVDISERRRLERRFRLAVEAAPNSMIMVDASGKIVLANRQAERLFGYSQEELLGQPMELLVPPHLRSRHVGQRDAFMDRPEARPMGGGRELFGWHKEGREIPVEIGLNPISSGEETFVLAAIVDISERREYQRKLAQSEALAAVGSMAAVMAHEIRNPLGSIVMAARSLMKGELAGEDRETVSAILTRESQRLNRTLQDFLNFARPREPRLAPSDLNRQVSELLQVLKTDPELARQVKLQSRLDETLGPFAYDPDQLGQVLWNLFLNGLQAMAGKGTLRVETAASGREALLHVDDTGPGVGPESVDKIFDPFYTTKKKGTGLGLAIARRIVIAHGGRLEVSKAPAGGARFTVVLPRSER